MIAARPWLRAAADHPASRSGGPRWVVVAAIVVALVVLAQLSLAETTRRPLLGVHAAREGDRLVLDWVVPASFAWDAGARPGDTVLAVEGRPVDARDDPALVATAGAIAVRAPGGAVEHATTETAILRSLQRRATFFVIAACFVAVGGVVFLLAADLVAARALLAFTTAWATVLLVATASTIGRAWALAGVSLALYSVGLTTMLFFLAFPVNHLASRAGRRVAWAAGGWHAALLAWYGWVMLAAPAAYDFQRPWGMATLVLDLLGACALAAGAFVGAPSGQRAVRRPLGLMALGAAIGFLPFCLLSLAPNLLGFGYPVAPDVAIGSVILLPVSLGAAVLSRQFLGITRFVSRGLVALAVWIGLLGVYSGGLGALRRLVEADQALLAPALRSPLLGIALVAGTFPILQGRLRRALEARLFPDIYDYPATLERLGAELTQLASVEAIAAHLLERLGATLDLHWAVIALRPEGGAPLLHVWGDPPAALDAGALLAGTPVPTLAERVPLIAAGSARGILARGPKRHDLGLLPEDRALVATLAPLVATALRNALLVRRLEAQVAALGERERELAALSGRLLRAQEEERRRIALDLHDDPLQRAVLLARDLGDGPEHPVTAHDRRVLEDIIGSLRAVCAGLRPPVLDDLGLVAGLEWLVDDVRARADFAVDLLVEPGAGAAAPRLEPALETALYRVAQEALNNCLKHARATRVLVALHRDAGRVILRVADDGAGCCPADAPAGGRAPHLGILGMRERLRPWGGIVAVDGGPGGGTVVTATVALRGADA